MLIGEAALPLDEAVRSVLTPKERERIGIGMQKEKSMHAILKNYKDPDPAHQEIPVGSYIADICDKDRRTILEVQTAGFGSMKGKLSAFLSEYQVTILYPIPHRKTICWMDPSTGEITQQNTSHFIGSGYELFRELSSIQEFLMHPNLRVEPVLIDMSEYKLQDGWSRDKKRGAHRFDRVPSEIVSDLILERAEDYSIFLPAAPVLPEVFTAKDLEHAVGIHRKSIQYSTVLKVLTSLGVTQRVGMTEKRAYQYRILIPNEFGQDFCRGYRSKRGSRMPAS
jgi:hypothetical protein